MDVALAISCLVGSYLVGGIPFGLLLAKYGAGLDIRTVGSGNIGATNVARALGWKWGVAALVLDVAKGVLPVLLFPLLLPEHSTWLPHVRVGCGLAAILGHVFPIYLALRGGKGVATSLGVIAVLSPWATLIAAAAFAITVACGRYVALASVVASLAFAVGHFVTIDGPPFSPENWSGSVFALLVPLLIVVRHRGNIARLWAGTEPRFSFGGRGLEIKPAPGSVVSDIPATANVQEADNPTPAGTEVGP